jgi:hypothetical protein
VADQSAQGLGASQGSARRDVTIRSASGRRDSSIPTVTRAARATGDGGRESDLSAAKGEVSSRRHRWATRLLSLKRLDRESFQTDFSAEKPE